MNLVEMKYRTALISLASEYRKGVIKKYGRFPSFDEYSIGNFSPSTQILFMHSDFPEIELILLFHLRERKDLEFRFYSSRDYNEMLITIASVLNDPLCTIVGERQVEMSLADLVRGSMQYNIITVPSKNSILMGKRAPSGANYSVQLLYGTILKIDPIELARKLVIQTAIKEPTRDLQQQIPQEVPILNGLGTHTDPPVWIDTAEKKPFIEKVYGYIPWKSSSIEYKVDCLGGHKALICKDGYIAIDTKDKEKALTAINTLLGSMMVLLDITFNVTRENDLGTAVFGSHSAGLSGGRFWTHFSLDSVAPVVIQRDQIKEIFALGVSVMEDPKLQTQLTLALEAKAHEKNGEWKQAILMGWLFLEDIYIADIWARQLPQVQMNIERKSKLNRYDIDTKVEILNILGIIDDDEYKLIRKLKKARNKAIHDGEIPKREDVTACLDKILKILRSNLGKV